MRVVIGEVFRGIIYGTTAVYSDESQNDALGAPDVLTFQVITDQVSGTTPTLTARVQHSADMRNWSNKNTNPEIDGDTINASAVTVLVGADDNTVPCLAYRRIVLTLGGTSPAANVRVIATGRDSG